MPHFLVCHLGRDETVLFLILTGSHKHKYSENDRLLRWDGDGKHINISNDTFVMRKKTTDHSETVGFFVVFSLF